MFADFTCVPDYADEQYAKYRKWQEGLDDRRLVVVEIGAGSTIPTVRRQSEAPCDQYGGTLVRINPVEPEAPNGSIEIPLKAPDAITRIAQGVVKTGLRADNKPDTF